ncbi:hypothetical protein L1987_42547 [Smallanthus sonchifolius]|uniref:Uncharacterized protein n=1 Tax=Smallanthus sonchifolius TaxID=185202 RepID=A0ACB9GIX6_9ASTR|nr:hypothetical protein L1987_42547 [Smallanthus sonchifolius]
MYERCFLQLRDEVKARLEKADTPLFGFSGERVLMLGQIELTVCLEDGPLSRTERLTFLVVRAPSRYNIIIGRPGISTFGAVVSTTHGLMKFPTDRGIATIKPKKEALLIAAAEEEKGAETRKNLRNEHKPFIPGAEDRSQVVCKEVDKLVKAGILREVQYQSWVANPVLVKKSDGSWRMCIDIKDLNQACPKDCYPLLEIDLKVDSLTGFKYKCFLDAYKGYHQIHMKKEDEEKTAFHTAKGIFCYKKMPFGLKNAGPTYQRVIDKTFTDQIGQNMEAYVDDLVIKSQDEEEMIEDIRETFDNLRSISMKLNPGKCSFGFEEGKFLGHIMGKQTERSLPFFQMLKGCLHKKDFRWTEEAEAAFQELKENIASLPTMVAPEAGELIFIYLSAGNEVVSVVLLIERNQAQMSVYFISRALKEAEVNYPPMEKLALSLVHTARRLRRYFQAHPIKVVTDQPIKAILERPETSGRLAKWAIELGEQKIEYVPRTAIKAQVLSDFLAEVPEESKEASKIVKSDEQQKHPPNTWMLFADGASSTEGSGAGLVLINLEGEEFTYALQLDFSSTNNEAEYEALFAGLRIAKEMKVAKIQVFVDLLLVANQVNNQYLAKEESIKKYKAKAQEFMQGFESCSVKQVS